MIGWSLKQFLLIKSAFLFFLWLAFAQQWILNWVCRLSIKLKKIWVYTLTHCLNTDIFQLWIKALKLMKLIIQSSRVNSLIGIDQPRKPLHSFHLFDHLLVFLVFQKLRSLMLPLKIIKLFSLPHDLHFLGFLILATLFNCLYTLIDHPILFYGTFLFHLFLFAFPTASISPQFYICTSVPVLDLLINLARSLAFWFSCTAGEMV